MPEGWLTLFHGVAGEFDRESVLQPFPTALEPVTDNESFVFYGMADSRIGVARLRRTD